MGGIVGYIGGKNGIPVVIDGLKRLEYRGYDSAGIVFLEDDKIIVRRRKGEISDLEAITATLTERRCCRPHDMGHAWQTFRKKGGY